MRKWLLVGLLALAASSLITSLNVYNNHEILTTPGSIYIHPDVLKNVQKEISEQTEIIKLHSLDSEEAYNAYINRSLLYSMIAKQEEALKDLNKVIQDNQELKTEALLFKAAVLFNLGKYREAIRLSNQVMERDHGKTGVFVVISSSYFAMGEFEKAAEYYKKMVNAGRAHGNEAIMYFIALERSGVVSRTPLQSYAPDGVTFLPWYSDIRKAFAGQYDWDTLVKQASDMDTDAERDRAVSIFFYYGQKKLLDNQPKKAKELFRKCLAVGYLASFEYWLAKAELERMGALSNQN